MSDSTLILEPVWLFVMIFGYFVFFVIGMFTPYVSAEDEEKAKQKLSRVIVTVRSRIDLPMVAAIVVPIWIIVVDILFFCDGFSSVADAIGYGAAASTLLTLIILVIADVIVWLVVEAIMALAATIVEWYMDKLYTERYRATVVHDEIGLSLYRLAFFE